MEEHKEPIDPKLRISQLIAGATSVTIASLIPDALAAGTAAGVLYLGIFYTSAGILASREPQLVEQIRRLRNVNFAWAAALGIGTGLSIYLPEVTGYNTPAQEIGQQINTNWHAFTDKLNAITTQTKSVASSFQPSPTEVIVQTQTATPIPEATTAPTIMSNIEAVKTDARNLQEIHLTLEQKLGFVGGLLTTAAVALGARRALRGS